MEDWHPEDIKAAVRKRGLTLTTIAVRMGLSRQAIALALRNPTERTGFAIARAIEVSVHRIWPSRFNEDGTRKPSSADKRDTQNRSGAKAPKVAK